MPKTEDPMIKRVAKWLKIGSLVSGSLGAILSPLLILYIDFAPKIRAARGEAEVGYETLAPAVEEIKEIQKKGVVWAGEVAEDITELKKRVVKQEERIKELEDYLKDLASKRRIPKPKPTVAMGKPRSPLIDFDKDGIEDSEEPPSDYLTQQTQRVVPANIDEAKKLQRARTKKKCAPSDPLCGTDAL